MSERNPLLKLKFPWKKLGDQSLGSCKPFGRWSVLIETNATFFGTLKWSVNVGALAKQGTMQNDWMILSSKDITAQRKCPNNSLFEAFVGQCWICHIFMSSPFEDPRTPRAGSPVCPVQDPRSGVCPVQDPHAPRSGSPYGPFKIPHSKPYTFNFHK